MLEEITDAVAGLESRNDKRMKLVRFECHQAVSSAKHHLVKISQVVPGLSCLREED